MSTDDIKARVEKLVGKPPCWSWSDDRLNDWYWDLIDRLAKDARLLGGEQMESTKEWIWSKQYGPHLIGATHTCLALDFQPIKQAVSKAEVLKFITDMQIPTVTWTTSEMNELASRIEKWGVEP